CGSKIPSGHFSMLDTRLDFSGLETVRKTLNEKGYTYLNGTIDCMQKDGDGGIGYVKYSIDFLPKTAIQPNDAEELGI
ncbi:hypothetical protein MOB06_11295, partial [Bacillus sp. S20C3]|nr:hypothetical protein [Bacillus sp. S20C3]